MAKYGTVYAIIIRYTRRPLFATRSASVILMGIFISDWQLTQTKPDTDPELAEVRKISA